MSAHPVITACIGGMTLFAFATLKWKKRKRALMEALATKSVLDLSEAIVNEHAPDLATSRQLLTTTDSDGRVDEPRWLEERDFFIDQIVEPQVGNITNSLDRLLAVWQMIDDATAQFAPSNTIEPPVPPNAASDSTDAPSTTTLLGRAA